VKLDRQDSVRMYARERTPDVVEAFHMRATGAIPASAFRAGRFDGGDLITHTEDYRHNRRAAAE
jgi:hypothetical protein